MAVRSTHSAADVSVGDVIAYPAVERDRGRRPHSPKRDPRDWLNVTRVENGFVYGTRVHPQDWEAGMEFSVYPLQIEEDGVEFAEDSDV